MEKPLIRCEDQVRRKTGLRKAIVQKRQKRWLAGLMLLFLLGGCGNAGFTVQSMQEGTVDGGGTETGRAEKSRTGDSEAAKAGNAGDVEGSGSGGASESESNKAPGNASEAEADSESDSESENTVVVYVCGAVREEGVYSLPENSRAADALAAAGGYADDAAKGVINLAGRLTDGEKLRFPSLEEVENGSFSGSFSEGSVGNGDQETESRDTDPGMVDLNRASLEELMTLPGIGEEKARGILEYREEHGGFQRAEELMQVPGIKEGIYRKLSGMIIVR